MAAAESSPERNPDDGVRQNPMRGRVVSRGRHPGQHGQHRQHHHRRAHPAGAGLRLAAAPRRRRARASGAGSPRSCSSSRSRPTRSTATSPAAATSSPTSASWSTRSPTRSSSARPRHAVDPRRAVVVGHDRDPGARVRHHDLPLPRAARPRHPGGSLGKLKTIVQSVAVVARAPAAVDCARRLGALGQLDRSWASRSCSPSSAASSTCGTPGG